MCSRIANDYTRHSRAEFFRDSRQHDFAMTDSCRRVRKTMVQFTRREALMGAICIAGASTLPPVAVAAGPPVVLFFDDDGLAASARGSLEVSGYFVTTIDLRPQPSWALAEPDAAMYVLASGDARRVLPVAKALGARRYARLLLFGIDTGAENGWYGSAFLRAAFPIVRNFALATDISHG
jgi:hypothetical protein